MNIFRTLELTGAEAFELVTAIIIIIVTVVALFLLYRNLSHEIAETRKAREAMREREAMMEEGEESSNNIISSGSKKGEDNIMGSINYRINHSKEGTLGVLYCLNLDDFRHIVDKYSQKDIDKLILELNKKLKKHGGKQAVAGHLDEDVFLYYYQGEVDADNMNRIATELLALVNEPLKTIEEQLTCSIGLVVFPYDGINAEQLHQNAEIAVYVSKKEGKNKFHMYSEDLIETEQFNANYYQEIKKSISNDEFILYYQPVVDVKTGRIIGLESLLRWNHPTMGVLPPGRFLNVMELTGDITWFGTWGFEQIVLKYKEWSTKMRIRDLFISTNLSPKQLEVHNLPQQFHNITKKHNMSPELFCLEIMDYYSIIKNRVAVSNLQESRRLGFRIAVDDMGDGFAVANDMTRINANIFKVTRSNVLLIMDKSEDSPKVELVIKSANENSKIVIAEGIEDENMIKQMADLNVRFMQGYYFSQPVSADQIEALIKKSPWNMSSFSHITK